MGKGPATDQVTMYNLAYATGVARKRSESNMLKVTHNTMLRIHIYTYTYIHLYNMLEVGRTRTNTPPCLTLRTLQAGHTPPLPPLLPSSL